MTINKNDFKFSLAEAYCYIYAHKNFGTWVPDSEKIITIEDLKISEKNDIIYCDVLFRLKWKVAIKILDFKIQVKESELIHLLESMVNKYLE